MVFALIGIGVLLLAALTRLFLFYEPTPLDAVEPRRVAFRNVRVVRRGRDEEVV
jgi:hypothetical protein